MPGNLSGRTDGQTDGRTCRKTVTVGRVDQRTHVQVKRGYFRLGTDGRTDGQPENIMPPAPKGGCIINKLANTQVFHNIHVIFQKKVESHVLSKSTIPFYNDYWNQGRHIMNFILHFPMLFTEWKFKNIKSHEVRLRTFSAKYLP